MKMQRHPFALIELLVVAVIWLASLLVPAWSAHAQVVFEYDATQLRSIRVNGFEMLTGGRGYFIGSPSGADGSGDGFTSYGSNGKRMTNNGPLFGLTFSKSNKPNTLNISGWVTLDNRDRVATVSLPFDFDKRVLTSWRFGGSKYRFNNEAGLRDGSSGTYASIPQPFRIPAKGPLLGYTGFAKASALPSWGEVSGPIATVRVTITSHTGAKELLFYNHFGTNNIEIGFGSMTRGQTVRIEGEITVTPAAKPSLRLESERDFSHEIGRADADGWSVNVRDPGNKYMEYGPYITTISGAHTATFSLMLDNVTADNAHVLTLDVFDANSGRTLASKQLRRKDFSKAMRYQDFVLPFTAPPNARLEFRTKYVNAVTFVRQNGVTIE